MENKITKSLIIVLGAIIFYFALANSVSAYVPNFAFSNDPVIYQYNSNTGNQGYSQYSYYQQSGYNPSNQAPVINNPYVQYGYYQQSGYTNNVSPNTSTAKPSVVNNYYYQTEPTKTTTISKSTTDTSNTTVNNTDKVDSGYNYNNGLGASAYNAGNGITALSLRGSGSFMPSSIWQWIFVVILILVIIILFRMFIRKPLPVEQDINSAHAH